MVLLLLLKGRETSSSWLSTPFITICQKRITQDWMKRRVGIYSQAEFQLRVGTATIQPRQNKEVRRFILMWGSDEHQRRWQIHPAASVHFSSPSLPAWKSSLWVEFGLESLPFAAIRQTLAGREHERLRHEASVRLMLGASAESRQDFPMKEQRPSQPGTSSSLPLWRQEEIFCHHSASWKHQKFLLIGSTKTNVLSFSAFCFCFVWFFLRSKRNIISLNFWMSCSSRF